MTALDSAKNTLHSFYKSVAEYVTPISDKSEFNQKGVLTPDEFVTAGDQLVYKCPTWTWETCESAKRWPFLPKDKQYLMTRNVPCVRRVCSLEAEPDDEEVVEDGEWLSAYTHHPSKKLESDIEDAELDTDVIKETQDDNEVTDKINSGVKKIDEPKKENTIISNIDEEYGNKVLTMTHDTEPQTEKKEQEKKEKEKEKEKDNESEDSFEEIPDIESFDDSNNIVTHDKKNEIIKSEPITNNQEINDNKTNEKDPNGRKFFSVKEEEETIVKTRTYDMSITYDKFYRVPRVWLRGYDEKGTPLTSKQIMEDISADHAHKTVTVESHPHSGMICASIHPCRHGEVMKRFMDRLE